MSKKQVSSPSAEGGDGVDAAVTCARPLVIVRLMHAGRATRLLRISRVALHLGRGLLTAAFVFPFQNQQGRANAIQRWSARLLVLLGVNLRVHGSPHDRRPLMLVANHVSWLDIFAINAVVATRFVAKSEIRGWPLLGWLC